MSNKSDSEKNPRRKFLSLGLPMMLGGGLIGCVQREESVVQSETESLRAISPKLILFEESGRVESELSETHGLCAGPNDTLYIAGDREILICNAAGQRQRSIPLNSSPRAVTVHSSGAILVALSDHIEIFDRNGARTAKFPSLGETALLTAITTGAIGGHDWIWVANSAGRIVLRCDAQGRVTALIGKKDSAHGYPGLIVPSPHLDVWLARDGRLRINNPGMHRIETHTLDGTYVSSWGVASSDVRDFCGCCNPTDFALLPDGRYITAEKGIPGVKIYSASGKFEGFVAPPTAFTVNAMGLDLASLSNGRIAVLDPTRKAVRLFRRKGKNA